MRGAFGLGLLILFLAATPAHAQNAKFLQKFSGWSAYVHDSASKKVCFVIAQPKEKLPKKAKRGPIYFYISHWQNDKVRHEISIKIGYPFRANSTVNVTIGKSKFKLFTKDEGAYVESADTEKRLVEAMKKGSLMTVQGRSSRGTLTTDKYSLSGISAALDRIAQECPQAGS